MKQRLKSGLVHRVDAAPPAVGAAEGLDGGAKGLREVVEAGHGGPSSETNGRSLELRQPQAKTQHFRAFSRFYLYTLQGP